MSSELEDIKFWNDRGLLDGVQIGRLIEMAEELEALEERCYSLKVFLTKKLIDAEDDNELPRVSAILQTITYLREMEGESYREFMADVPDEYSKDERIAYIYEEDMG